MAETRIEPEPLAANGWTFYEKCRCGGTLKWKYRNLAFPDLELEWWTRYYQFRITYRGKQTKVPLTKIEKLDKTLKELV